jgi:hypothetical protein
MESCTAEESIALASPFFRAYPDESWRELTASFKRSHGLSTLQQVLLSYRRYNDLLSEFEKTWGRRLR